MPIEPSAPVIPSGREIYDSIMAKIEPELVTHNLSKLDDFSFRGTKTERSARKRRHAKALLRYRAEYEKYISSLSQSVRRFERTARKFAENESKRRHEYPLLKSLQASFD